MNLKDQVNYERQYVDIKCGEGFHCERVAGSGRKKQSVADCILFRDNVCLVEVKATKDEVFRVTARTRRQLERMVTVCHRHGLQPLLAIRFKRRGWKEVDLYNGIPKKVSFR